MRIVIFKKKALTGKRVYVITIMLRDRHTKLKINYWLLCSFVNDNTAVISAFL